MLQPLHVKFRITSLNQQHYIQTNLRKGYRMSIQCGQQRAGTSTLAHCILTSDIAPVQMPP